MNLSDVDEVGELSEPDFVQNSDTVGIPPTMFPVMHRGMVVGLIFKKHLKNKQNLQIRSCPLQV